MNLRRLSIILFGINLALLGLVAYLLYVYDPGAIRQVAAPPEKGTRTLVVTNRQVAVHKVNATNLLALLGGRPLNWASIESTNYVTFIENLRAFGCPEETIRDIILTDIAKVFGKKRSALVAQGHVDKFWLPSPDEGGDPQLQQQIAELDEQERKLVKELLGVDFQTEVSKYWQDNEIAEQRMYGFLPEAKQGPLKELNSKYESLEQEIYARGKGELLPEDEEKLRALEKEKEAEMARILSPEEMEEYQLRNSSTAANMRTQLAGFQPTEEEFRKMFRVQKVFDEQFKKGFDLTDESALALQSKAQGEAQQALKEELKKTLGEARYNEYARAMDSDYRSLQNISSRYNLPQETAANIYNVKQQAEAQKRLIDSNPNLTAQQRQNALDAIAAETRKEIAKSLGDKPYKAYSGGSGSWIRGLAVSDNPVVAEPPPSAPANTGRQVPTPPVPPGFIYIPPPPGVFPLPPGAPPINQ